jgi:hypothetical protein
MWRPARPVPGQPAGPSPVHSRRLCHPDSAPGIHHAWSSAIRTQHRYSCSRRLLPTICYLTRSARSAERILDSADATAGRHSCRSDWNGWHRRSCSCNALGLIITRRRELVCRGVMIGSHAFRPWRARRDCSRRRTAPLVEIPPLWLVRRCTKLIVFYYQLLAALANHGTSMTEADAWHTQFQPDAFQARGRF